MKERIPTSPTDDAPNVVLEAPTLIVLKYQCKEFREYLSFEELSSVSC